MSFDQYAPYGPVTVTAHEYRVLPGEAVRCERLGAVPEGQCRLSGHGGVLADRRY